MALPRAIDTVHDSLWGADHEELRDRVAIRRSHDDEHQYVPEREPVQRGGHAPWRMNSERVASSQRFGDNSRGAMEFEQIPQKEEHAGKQDEAPKKRDDDPRTPGGDNRVGIVECRHAP